MIHFLNEKKKKGRREGDMQGLGRQATEIKDKKSEELCLSEA